MAHRAEWDGAPFKELAVGAYGAKAIGPHLVCESLDLTRCRGLWSLDGVQRFELEDVGLTVTAFPSAHSVVIPILDDEREHPPMMNPTRIPIFLSFRLRTRAANEYALGQLDARRCTLSVLC